MIQCCIRRNKGPKNALFPEYRMYLETNNSKTETFLMTSKKRGKIVIALCCGIISPHLDWTVDSFVVVAFYYHYSG